MSHRRIIRGYKRLSARLDNRSRIQIYRDIKAGKFPAPIELGPNSVGWFEDEIDEHLASRPRRTYGAEHSAEAEVNDADDLAEAEAGAA